MESRPDYSELSITSISAGSSHSLAVVTGPGQTRVLSWGRGEDGQLGHGTASDHHRPCIVRVLSGEGASDVVCGAEFSVAVCQSGQAVFSWGWGDFGRLGHGDCNDIFVPRSISCLAGRDVASVACGDTHTLVVLASGILLAFGRNACGQLGNGTNTDCLHAVEVAGLQGESVVGAACGAEHSACVTKSGRVFGWGWGRYGNLGNGHRSDEMTPSEMLGLEGVHAANVVCGWRHTLIVDERGQLYSTGWSKYGQLGHGDWQDHLAPAPIQALEGKEVRRVDGGWRHTVAATTDTLYAWGWNKFGQCGLGNTENVNMPTVVTALSEGGTSVERIACGWKHTIVVTSAGDVYTWGRGTAGQLGFPTGSDMTLSDFEGQLRRASLFCRPYPTRVDALCRGSIDLAALEGSPDEEARMFVPACDRYAIVPGSDEAAHVVPDADAPDDMVKRQRRE